MVSVAHGVAPSRFGSALFAVARDRFWLLAGAFSDFWWSRRCLPPAFIAQPGALERGERLTLLCWCAPGRAGVNRRSDPSSYWCLVRFGLLLAFAGTGWVLTSAAFITLFSPVAISFPKTLCAMFVGT